jgi:hypothetical protein
MSFQIFLPVNRIKCNEYPFNRKLLNAHKRTDGPRDVSTNASGVAEEPKITVYMAI